MDSLESKKLALVRILQILEKHSDESHPLLQADIARHLERDYGLVIERKAIGRNLSLLKEAGFYIESGRGGCYLAERSFTDAELRILIDGVLSSKYISKKYSKDLVEKLCGLSSKYFLSHVKHIHAINDFEKTENQSLFYYIDLVDEAIEQSKQIKIDYGKYGPDKKLHKTYTQTISPYQMILHNQRYYLMGWNEYWKTMGFYRLDHILKMSMTEDKLTPIKSLEGHQAGINYKELSTSFPYMFTDTPQWVEFIAEDYIIDQVIDWFGRDIQISRINEKQFKIKVKVSLKAMEHWAKQYAPHITVTSPPSLVQTVKDELMKAVEKYKEGKGTQ